MQGKLFTQDFLREGIKETDAWKCLDSNELTRFRARIGTIFDTFPADSQANEAVTESSTKAMPRSVCHPTTVAYSTLAGMRCWNAWPCSTPCWPS